MSETLQAIRSSAHPSFTQFRRAGRDFLFHLPDPIYAYIKYFRTHGRILNLRNPRTFNEKIWHRKLYQRDPKMVSWADKLKVKELVADVAGPSYVLPTLWQGESAGGIPFDSLPRPYVLKTNHGACGKDMLFVRTGERINHSEARETMQAALEQTYGLYGREWAYSQIKHKVFAEPMMIGEDGGVPADYKFHVFDGKVRFVELHANRFSEHRVNHYTEDWQLLPFELELPNLDTAPSPPACFGEMKRVAERIGARFDYVRVDLYEHRSQVIFGEVTFYPGGGSLRFRPAVWDLRYGSAWHLSSCRG